MQLCEASISLLTSKLHMPHVSRSRTKANTATPSPSKALLRPFPWPETLTTLILGRGGIDRRLDHLHLLLAPPPTPLLRPRRAFQRRIGNVGLAEGRHLVIGVFAHTSENEKGRSARQY